MDKKDSKTIKYFKKNYDGSYKIVKKLCKKYVREQTIKSHAVGKEKKKRKKDVKSSNEYRDNFNSSDSDANLDCENSTKNKHYNNGNKNNIYAVSESIDKKSYFIIFLNIHTYTTINFEIVAGSDSKSIKIIFLNQIDEEDKQLILYKLLNLGAPINPQTINVIGFEHPHKEYIIEFHDPVDFNGIEQTKVIGKQVTSLSIIFKVKKKVVNQTIVSFKNVPIPITETNLIVNGNKASFPTRRLTNTSKINKENII
ncbi:hypothetical protein DICPUDRAFT_83373 [Dictyostelium purpureum]|uniref:Uncharacterized protein n=1 Tax=Dictyostelium purpureum TaxID=5786 RepID=F0ZZC4_DICPU|nr:uncharacterized protein DICPUDRAFT_83373 [Dictyostelium purpureum]EGC30706.1 hypothetical protein DICPUDRAFT_83373 [Dictyostelium purpureum]|eukprot:XP_003292769.1 hypothetical protein DICPUDRAFT_83373 [Dictyostelium purpureum]